VAVQSLHIDDFLAQSKDALLIDVRSPGEYFHGHIPGAVSIPLFTDEERKVVGTAYKQQSREQAIKIGLEYYGPKMRLIVEEVEELLKKFNSKQIFIHCWRGGMRSGAVAWLLDLYGFKVYSLKGGYKSYRNWCLQQFEKQLPFVVLGGHTGSGKTETLLTLKHKGNVVVDLEALACHRGSAFGNLGQPKQPSQEMFENILAGELFSAEQNINESGFIWVEDESQRIGDLNIPINLYKYIKTRPVAFLQIPFEERLKRIIDEYGKFEREKLADAIMRITKRLGGLETKNALYFLDTNDIESCFRILLSYYDKWYGKSIQARENFNLLVHEIKSSTTNAEHNSALLMKFKPKENYV
jgi:tRNA 2-selenouridine synthase